MKFSGILAIATTLVSLASAAPATKFKDVTTPFYLVTTTQSTSNSHSSKLKNVSATTVFAPYYQPNLLLREIEPGYGSLPTWTLTNGTLHTTQAGPHGIGSYVYNSTSVQAGGELQFLAQSEPNSGFALKSGYLLTINGTEKGWTLCTGDLGQTVVSARDLVNGLSDTNVFFLQVYYKGTDASCTPTYIQAVSTPPY